MNDNTFERLLKESLIEAADQDYVERPVKELPSSVEPSDGFKHSMAQLLRNNRTIQRPDAMGSHSLWSR